MLCLWATLYALPAQAVSGCHSGSTPDPLPSCEEGDDRPNIVMIMFDDLGSGDLSPYALDPPPGASYHLIETPNIEALADEGMVFDQYYVTPTCSPTRASLLSGGYQQRVNVRKQLQLDHNQSNRGIPATLTSLPEMLRKGNDNLPGYTTAHFGKWHAGFSKDEFQPLDVGFNEACTLQEATDDMAGSNGWGKPGLVYCNPGVRDGNENVGVEVPGYTTKILVDYAIDFIRRAKAQKCPFFIQIWLWAPHAALDWSECPVDEKTKMDTLRAKYNALGVKVAGRSYAAIIDRADQEIGRLREELFSQNLLKDTLILVASDNGGLLQFGNDPNTQEPSLPPTNGNLTGFKGQVYEGGIRSPLIARWGNNIPQIANPGCDPLVDPLCPYTRHRDPVMRFELYATLAELAQVDPAELDFDGESFADTFTNPEVNRSQQVLVWEQQQFNHGFEDDDGQWNDWAVRKENWKATYNHECATGCSGSLCQCTSALHLFDLAASPTETTNDDVSSDPGGADRIAALEDEYYDWRREVALLPLETGIIGGAKLQDRDLRTIAAAHPGQFLRFDDETRYDFYDANFSFSTRIFPDAGTLAPPGCVGSCKTMIATKPGSWELAIIATRQVQLTIFDDGGSAQILTSDQIVQENAWNWLAFTVYGWKGTDSLVRLYTNNLTPKACDHHVLPSGVACTTDVAAVQRTGSRVTVGGDFSGQRQFEGTMRDIEFYVSSLQDEELRRLFEDFDNELFYDSFENGLGTWQQPPSVQGTSTLGLGGPGVIDNNRLEIGINATGDRAFLTTLTPDNETRIRTSFALDLNNVILPDGSPQRVLVARRVNGATVQNTFWVDVRTNQGIHEARAMARNNSGLYQGTPWIAFDGTIPQTFEVRWKKAEPQFKDGQVSLRVGDQTTERTYIDNDQVDLDIDRIDLGLVTPAVAGTSGVFHFDQFESYRY